MSLTSDEICAVVIGGSGGIAEAIIARLQDSAELTKVIVFSRSNSSISPSKKIEWRKYDGSEEDISYQCKLMSNEGITVVKVFICIGFLHNDSLLPEKKIEDLSAEKLNKLINVNTVLPILWVKNLINVIKSPHKCLLITFSARVGSISDNHLGGWYSYRASKAALNMLLKTAAIEYGRRAKNVTLIAYHPGTTATDLSKPFSKKVPKEKLFTPTQAVEFLFSIDSKNLMGSTLHYLDWKGDTIDW